MTQFEDQCLQTLDLEDLLGLFEELVILGNSKVFNITKKEMFSVLEKIVDRIAANLNEGALSCSTEMVSVIKRILQILDTNHELLDGEVIYFLVQCNEFIYRKYFNIESNHNCEELRDKAYQLLSNLNEMNEVDMELAEASM